MTSADFLRQTFFDRHFFSSTIYEIRKERTSMELLEKILDNKNLYNAYKQVYRNKGASGVDGTIDVKNM